MSKGKGPSLMGRNWFQRLPLDWLRVNYVADPVSDLSEKYSFVFNSDQGVISGVHAKLKLLKMPFQNFARAEQFLMP